jgi:hypothetical protein
MLPDSRVQASTPTPSTGATLPDGLDAATTIVVLNGTQPGRQGLAGRVRTRLLAAGWSDVTSSTLTGTPPTVTTVYYSRSTLKAAALEIVKELGTGRARLSASRAGGGITVILRNDYRE